MSLQIIQSIIGYKGLLDIVEKSAWHGGCEVSKLGNSDPPHRDATNQLQLAVATGDSGAVHLGLGAGKAAWQQASLTVWTLHMGTNSLLLPSSEL